ncbi:MAG: pilus assembly protein TadG-related protein [Actinomycetes bacterium]
MSVRRDDGAIAIIVAILALTLFGIGALAVDLGNMFSRKRMAQSAADFAALAGAAQLPDASAAIDEAYDYLANHDPVGDGAFTKAQLTNNDPSDGEIVVDPNRLTISVDLAPREVTFGLAASLGFTSGSVSAHAVAGLKSPSKLLPFFLPIDCSNGPQILKENSQSAGPAIEPPPVYQIAPAATDPTGPKPDMNALAPSTGSEGVSIPSFDVEGNHFEATGMLVDFTRGTTVETISNPTTVMGNGNRGTVTVAPVPAVVTSTPGNWHVRVWTTRGWSDSRLLTIDPAVPPPPSRCGQKATGDFGMLDSPRRDVNGTNNQLRRNIALGLDHGVVEFPGVFPPKTLPDNCRVAGNAPIPGGILDNDPNIDNANCMDIKNGNTVDVATEGLIVGGSGFTGRLTGTASRTCPGAGGVNPTTVLNTSINNDTIDCYLLPTRTVSELVDPSLSTAVLDPSIVDSPRFFFVPAINYEFNPPNGFYPVVTMKGVFITDQTTNNPATNENGLKTSNSKLTQIQVLAFNVEALPQSVATGGNGIPYFGSGPKVIRLIE